MGNDPKPTGAPQHSPALPGASSHLSSDLTGSLIVETPLLIEPFIVKVPRGHPGGEGFPELLLGHLRDSLKLDFSRPISLGSGVCATSFLVEIGGTPTVFKIVSEDFYTGDTAQVISEVEGKPYDVLTADLKVVRDLRKNPGLPRYVGHIEDELGVVVAVAKEFIKGPLIGDMVKAGEISRSHAEALINEYIDFRVAEGLYPCDINFADYMVATLRDDRKVLYCVDPNSMRPLSDGPGFAREMIISVLLDRK